jgi:hypothetical protein
LESIPDRHAVVVYDWASRSKYRFHANTIHGNIVAALRYTSIAMSMPKAPKNPYTNLEWSIGQLWVLVDQMQRCFWNVGHRFMDPAVQMYSLVVFSISKLRVVYGRQLDVDCARRFFRDPTSEYWEVLYAETLVDLFSILKPTRSYFLRGLIMDRSLSAELLQEWDTLVTEFWCYDNLNQLIGLNAVSIMDIINSAKDAQKRTEAYVAARREVRRQLASKKKEGTS